MLADSIATDSHETFKGKVDEVLSVNLLTVERSIATIESNMYYDYTEYYVGPAIMTLVIR